MVLAVIWTAGESVTCCQPLAVSPVKVTDPATKEATEKLYGELTAAGIDVLLDDRDVRAGVKFKDADLIGIPLRIVISERGLKDGKLEMKWRWAKEAELIEIAGASEGIGSLIVEERKANSRFRGR